MEKLFELKDILELLYIKSITAINFNVYDYNCQSGSELRRRNVLIVISRELYLLLWSFLVSFLFPPFFFWVSTRGVWGFLFPKLPSELLLFVSLHIGHRSNEGVGFWTFLLLLVFILLSLSGKRMGSLWGDLIRSNCCILSVEPFHCLCSHISWLLLWCMTLWV